ncbi:MAG: hypothetical protein U0176_02810 [Bacteroidia bacterium]
MASTGKIFGRSIAEALLFQTIAAGIATTLNSVLSRISGDSSAGVVFALIVGAIAGAAIVALIFPKPTWTLAFAKILLAAIFASLIVLGFFAVFGPIMFEVILEFLWNVGGYIWDWGSAGSIIGGVIAIIMYVIFTVAIIGLLMSAFFALANAVVLVLFNRFLENRQEVRGS